jgi:uncharacterized protein YxeA
MGELKTMKKIIATFIALVIMSMAALPAAAQTRKRSYNRSVYQNRTSYRNDNLRNRRYRTDAYRYRNNDYRYRNEDYRYRNDDYRYRDDDWRYGDDRSVWEKHRDKITTAAGAGGGAVIGGLVGGKKGAIIGAIAGGAGAAIYTYKIRDKNRRY